MRGLGLPTTVRHPVVAAAAAHVPPQRMAIPEPARRTPLPWLVPNRSALHTASMSVRPPRGARVAGPPMLRPSEIDGVLTAARERARQRRADRSSDAQPASAPRRVTAPGSTRGVGAPASGAVRTPRSVPSSSSGTGINPWWRYQEENIPGGGHVMVNVSTGNVLVQDDDMAVPHKGVSLTLRRTYNSQSQHDTAGTDGAVPSLYGNGWTNTFDAHLSGSRTGTISVWDVDGARYDYTVAADGVTMVPPPGQHATLVTDDATGYFWTKKSGTTYYFWAPDGATAWPSSVYQQYGAYAGRLYQIIGRNRNTYLTFLYSWDNGNSAAGGKISAIASRTESGLTANLSFADVGGLRLLSQVTYPDGATTVSYGYDQFGDLVNVSRPPNNAAGTRLSHSYGYQTLGTYTVMAWADSPRWESCASGCGSDGAWFQFWFTGTSASLTLNAIGHGGVVNLGIPDGSSSPTLQSGYPTTAVWYLSEYFTAGTTPTFRDSDGHATNWVVDSLGRPTQTQECTATTGGSCSGTWLVSNQTWDADNNLVTQTDPRGNETDYLHDPMGNATAVAEPVVTTSQGTFQPTQLYDYDAFNNVVAYCDATETHAAHADWTVPAPSVSPNESLCASQAGSAPHWRATYAYPSYEPYGELTSMTTPLGYTRTFSYAPSQQAGADDGLPTAVTGDSYTQRDGTVLTPSQSLWYDANGWLRCYSKGVGTSVLSYDALGRMTSIADPDDSSANATSLCAKSSGRSGWNTQTTMTYFPDGSQQSHQTPAQRQFGVSSTFTYDADGNVRTQTDHHGCIAQQPCPGGVITKWYDGADRLVEVAQPTDASANAWNLRYLYDLSAGAGVMMTGSPLRFAAYGNLYKTQTYVAGVWTDQRGSQFDALDREVRKYSYSITATGGSTAALETAQLLYDADPGTLGLLKSKTNPNGESVSYDYDALARIAKATYAGEAGLTPAETYSYDANGRAVAITSSVYGAQQYAYDADGRMTQSIEPSGGGLTGAAQLSYAFYPDGRKAALSVSSPSLNQSNAITYSYRADGPLQTQTLGAYGGGVWNKTYTDAGRPLGVSGAAIQSYSYDTGGEMLTQGVRGGRAQLHARSRRQRAHLGRARADPDQHAQRARRLDRRSVGAQPVLALTAPAWRLERGLRQHRRDTAADR